MKTRPTSTKGRGRPSAGALPGERVTDYPQIGVRVPPETRERLQALSALRGLPQWQVINDAIECYLRDLPADEQRAVELQLREARNARKK